VRFSVTGYLSEAAAPALAALVMAAAVLGVESLLGGQRPALQLAAGVTVGLVVYLAMLLLLARKRLSELVDLARGLKR